MILHDECGKEVLISSWSCHWLLQSMGPTCRFPRQPGPSTRLAMAARYSILAPRLRTSCLQLFPRFFMRSTKRSNTRGWTRCRTLTCVSTSLGLMSPSTRRSESSLRVVRTSSHRATITSWTWRPTSSASLCSRYNRPTLQTPLVTWCNKTSSSSTIGMSLASASRAPIAPCTEEGERECAGGTWLILVVS